MFHMQCAQRQALKNATWPLQNNQSIEVDEPFAQHT